MKALDVIRDASLPIPVAQADRLLAQHGRRLYPRMPDSDPFIAGIDCSADGGTLIGYGSKFLLVWSANVSLPRERVRVSGEITCAAINSTGSIAIVGTASGKVILYEIPGLEIILERQEELAIHAVDVSDLGVFAVCDVAGKVTTSDYLARRELPAIHYTGSAGRIWLTHEGELLIVDDENAVFLFHTQQGLLESKYVYGDRESEEQVLAASGWIAAKRDNQVHIWNRSTTSQVVVLDHRARVCAFDMDSSMRTVAAITSDQRMYLYAPRNPHSPHRATVSQTYVREPHSIKLRSESVFLGGRELTALQITRGNVPVRTYYDHLIPIVSAHISGDERRLTVGDQAGGVSIYDLKDGRRVLDRLEIREAGAISVVDVDLDRKIVLAGGHDGALRIIRLGKSAHPVAAIRRIDLGSSTVQAACLAGEYAYVGTSAGAVTKVDLETGERLAEFAAHSVLIRCVLHCDEVLISTDQQGGIGVFDATSSALVHKFQVDDTAYRACVDRNRRRLYVGARDGRVVCWDLLSGEVVDEIRLNQSTPRYIQVRGDKLVGVGLDGDLSIFDLVNRRQTIAIEISGCGWQRYAYLNKSGTRVMTAGADGIMRFFCAETGVERARGLHTAKGFFWLGNDRHGVEPEWLWTDQPESAEIVAHRGNAVEVLAEESDERRCFLLERNSQRTMSHVGIYPDLATPPTGSKAISRSSITHRLPGPGS